MTPRPRWKRWVFSTSAVVLLLGVLGPPLTFEYRVHRARKAVADRVAALDAADPGWDLAATVARLNAAVPPDGENALAPCRAAVALLHAGMNPTPAARPANVRMTAAEAAAVDAALARCAPALAALRPVIGRRIGGRVLVMPDNPVEHRMQEAQDQRKLAEVAWLASTRAAERGDFPAAVRHAREGVGLARALGNEPTAIGVLVRVSVATVAADSAGRVLNLGEPRDGLAELQADLLAEANTDHVLTAQAGERAMADGVSLYLLRDPSAGPWTRYAARAGLLEARAALLDVSTARVGAARRPVGEQRAALRTVTAAGVGSDNRLVQLLLLASDKVTDAGLRCRGHLGAAAAAVACERFRQSAGRWPDALADLVPGLLPAVPVDPFTGGPVAYKRLADGVVVYSVGPDGTDDGGAVGPGEATPTDFGVRLWDPARRGLPAP